MNQQRKEIKDFWSGKKFWILYFLSIIFYPVFIIASILIIALLIYKSVYFNSDKFKTIKNNISQYVDDCNGLNDHIEALKNTYANFNQTDYGEAEYSNISKYQYKKAMLSSTRKNKYVYDCSRSVCTNASKQPFKFICKYFNINTDERTLEEFEEVLNNFSAADEGKEKLLQKRDAIINMVSNDVPSIIRKLLPKTLDDKLGFSPIHINDVYYPVFTFRYVSSGGNSGNQFDVQMNPSMLERFIHYLSDKIKYSNSVAGQRLLMTPKLRQQIIQRDNCTCKICGNSTYKEPNLLLEVDHIIPVSKGGKTTEENLQTLCWKCNRHKGARI